MRLNPHLSFDGRCLEAFEFYASCLGGAVSFRMTYADSPLSAQFPPELGDRIMHASVAVGDQLLTGADVPSASYRKPEGFSILYSLEDAAAAGRIFATLADGGSVQMPLQETFWAERFGMLTDRFGVPWTINCSRRATPQG